MSFNELLSYPCPPTSKFIPGYLSKNELKKTEVYLKIKTISECFKICSRPCICGSCNSILYSQKSQRCEILSQAVNKAAKKNYKDFVICVKTSESSGDQCSTEKQTTTDTTDHTVVKDSCCDSYKVESTGDIKTNQISTIGTYMREGTHNGKPVYKKEKNLLYYSKQKTWP